jgi:putative tricarboxylic transport membrane protein
MSRDAIAGLAVLAASLVLFALTLDLKQNPLVPIGPGFYPRIVLGLSTLLAALLVVLGFMQKRAGKAAVPRAVGYGAVLLHFALFGVYVVALPWIGFRIATFAYVAAANAFMAPPRNALQWGRAGALGLVTALATYYVFEYYLSVLLPRGRWTDF